MIDTNQSQNFQAGSSQQEFYDENVSYTIQEQPIVTKTEQFEGQQIIIMNENDAYEEIYAEPQGKKLPTLRTVIAPIWLLYSD